MALSIVCISFVLNGERKDGGPLNTAEAIVSETWEVQEIWEVQDA